MGKRNLIGLAAMTAALGLASGGMAPPATSSAQSPIRSREFVGAPHQTRQGKKKKRVTVGDGGKGQPWRHFKNGDATDGNGCYRSAKRLRRKRLCAEHGVTTGRQWVRLRKALRRGVA